MEMQPMSSHLRKNSRDALGGDAAIEFTLEKKPKKCIRW
jgi:hypothetical protein